MKNLTFVVVSAILVSVLGVSQSGVINEPLDKVESYSLIDPIIKGLLEAMRSKLANLTINDINETFGSPKLNATVIVTNISLVNADKFIIQELKTDIIPLRMKNLTLSWNDISANAHYDISAAFSIPKIDGPFNLFAKGYATAILNHLHFTLGANLDLKNNVLQVKPKGLFGFNVKVGSANVTLTSLMGNPDLGKAVGMLISEFIPKSVDALKNPLFVAFQDDLIRIINAVLKKKDFFMDEEQMPPSESSESFLKNWNLNKDTDSSFSHLFDLGMDETEFELEHEF